jgi:hypothetical protein
MFLSGQGLWELLSAHDDPDNLEYPRGFDFRAARERFDRLVDRLEGDFNATCLADRHVQDASLHGRVDVPASATATGRNLVVCVSNFGDLAVVSLDNPGASTQEEFEHAVASLDVDRIASALDDCGYILLAEEPLWADYSGPSALTQLDSRNGATWWTRYFDYL